MCVRDLVGIHEGTPLRAYDAALPSHFFFFLAALWGVREPWGRGCPRRPPGVLFYTQITLTRYRRRRSSPSGSFSTFRLRSGVCGGTRLRSVPTLSALLKDANLS